MPAIENNTPFAAEVVGLFDRDGRELHVLVVNATFEVFPGKVPRIADQQRAVDSVDAYRGDPATSSITYPGQLAYAKPMIDLIVTGHAYAPHGRPVESMTVGVRVGDIRKVVQVTGDRFWRSTPVGRRPSSARHFDRMPVIYERAFGGGAVRAVTDSGKPAYEPRNPVGIGLPGTRSGDEGVGSDLPNIEYPSGRMTTRSSRPLPAGFGAIGPSWQPRVSLAGTYDEAWLSDQAPLLPHDFKPEFFQVAPNDQQSQAIHAGDVVEVVGMTPEGRWSFESPSFDVQVSLV